MKKLLIKEIGNQTINNGNISAAESESPSNRHQAELEKEIKAAETAGVDLRGYSEKTYSPFQLHEIRMGLKNKIDVSLYANSHFSWAQMYEIRKGIENGVDASIYAKVMFLNTQMHQIRIGLELGLDVSSYAKLIYSTSDMKKMRSKLFNDKYKIVSDCYGRTLKDEETGISIRLSNDLLSAYVTLPEEHSLTVFDITRALKNNGIIFGISKELIQDALNENTRDEFLAAQGIPYKQGKNGFYSFLKTEITDDADAARTDGTVDFSAAYPVEMVKKGDKVAIYTPPESGSNGYTVFGDEIINTMGKEIPKLSGNDIFLLEDGVTYVAKRDGHIIFHEDTYSIEIQNIILINNDVTYLSGYISCPGSIKIKGNVCDGAIIDAKGDVIIDGFVQGAYISAGNNIIISGGVNADNSGYVAAQRNIMGDFFEKAFVRAGADIETNYIINSNIIAGENVRAKGVMGIICGGSVAVGKSVFLRSAGNIAHMKTSFKLGDKKHYVDKLAAASSHREQVEKEITLLKKAEQHMILSIPPEQLESNDTYVKVGIALRMKIASYNSLTAEISSVLNSIELQKDVSLNASSVIYPNVDVNINGIMKIVREECENVTFLLRGESIISKQYIK